MTFRSLLLKGQQALENAGIIEAKNDAWLLMNYSLSISRTFYFVHMTDDVREDQCRAYEEVISARSRRIPLQYLTGEQEFMGLPFHVTPDVLIPRQDTETLVEEALKVAKPGMKILDLCTGSGCILIALLKHMEGLSGTGADISQAALAVAGENAALNGVNADFICSDLFDRIGGVYDMIVSNPPYIPSAVIETLMPEVAQHEPIGALDGSEDGLYFYRQITAKCREHLAPGGKILFEIGNDQGKDVSEMLTNAGFRNVRVIKDLAYNDRVVYGEL